MKRVRFSSIILIIALLCLALAGCAPGKTVVTLASTTSTEDSGLFSVLVPAFEEANPDYELRVIAVGTGEALELGRRKDADVLLVHAPSSEKSFMDEGHGMNRQEVMRNDFVILGPESDPASISEAPTVTEALDFISAAAADFITRGDDSGTHKKEVSLWAASSVQPDPSVHSWYISTGQGMGESLTIASEKQTYIVSDKATYLTRQDNLELEVLFEGGDDLINIYSVIEVTNATEAKGAAAFAEWITSDDGRDVIAEFGPDEFSEPLFTPVTE